MKARFEWVVSPDVIADGVKKYGAKMLVAVQAAATYWGQHVQNKSRDDAPWEDRTGAARGGLFFAVDGFGLEPMVGTVTPEAAQAQDSEIEIVSGSATQLIITLGHTVFYGKFLELLNGGRYAIIMSTMEENLPMLERLIGEYGNNIT
jgi:hypothetical protein